MSQESGGRPSAAGDQATSPEHGQDDEPTPLDTAQKLRVAANPARVRILSELAWGKERTSDIADKIGIPANSASYHLRLMAQAGFVRSTEGEDRRETWWELTSEHGWAINLSDDALHEPGAALVRQYINRLPDLLERSAEIADRTGWPMLSSDTGLLVTESEAREIVDRLSEILHELGRRRSEQRRAGAKPGPGQARFLVVAYALPLSEPVATEPVATERADD